MTSKDQDLDTVNKALAILSEHFENSQIFVSRIDSSAGGTVNIAKGTGNWFARRGQIQDWLVKENEGSRETVRQDHDSED